MKTKTKKKKKRENIYVLGGKVLGGLVLAGGEVDGDELDVRALLVGAGEHPGSAGGHGETVNLQRHYYYSSPSSSSSSLVCTKNQSLENPVRCGDR